MMTIEDYIECNATTYPDKIAVVCDNEKCTYKALHERIKRKAINMTVVPGISVSLFTLTIL